MESHAQEVQRATVTTSQNWRKQNTKRHRLQTHRTLGKQKNTAAKQQKKQTACQITENQADSPATRRTTPTTHRHLLFKVKHSLGFQVHL